MRETLRRHRVACFLVVTYAVTWGAWIPMAIAGREVGVGLSPTYLLGLLGPLIGAVVTTAITGGRDGLRELGTRMIRVRAGRWWFVALGLPLAVYATSYVVMAAYSMFLLSPSPLPTWATLGRFNGFPATNAAALLAWLVIVNGFGEETGWRGFLLPAFHRKHSPLVASLLVAACWAPWHLPAFFVAETFRTMPIALVPIWLLGLVSGSIFLGWLYLRGHRSIPLVAVFHGTFNLVSGTVGVRGPIAAVESIAVMLFAAVLVVQDLHVMTASPAAR